MLLRNVVVLRGALAAEPRQRELPSGSVIAQFDITSRDEGGTQTVPVAWFDPPSWSAELEPGTELVVIGSVRRRFFRVGGVTQSRTEVVAEKVVPARRGREVRRVVEAVCRALQGESEEVAVTPSG
jgi:single-strand DNA-binding protein